MNELPKCHICKEDCYPMKIASPGFCQFNFRVMILRGFPIYLCEQCFIGFNEITEMLLDRFYKENKIEKGLLII